MIERLHSKKGHAIAKCAGRYVCSSIDPAKEANDWVHKLSRRLKDMKTVIVLGVGCGYHLVQLRKSVPGATILALDFNRELIEFSEATHSTDWAGIRNVCLSDFENVAECSEICNAIKESYAVVKFAPVTLHDPASYREVEVFLLGRSWSGFQFITRERNRFSGLFQNTVHALPVDSNSLLSIKSLCERLSPNECRESMLLRALRELVV
jgi:hypothetical protein